MNVDREKTKSGASICFGDNNSSELSDNETDGDPRKLRNNSSN